MTPAGNFKCFMQKRLLNISAKQLYIYKLKNNCVSKFPQSLSIHNGKGFSNYSTSTEEFNKAAKIESNPSSQFKENLIESVIENHCHEDMPIEMENPYERDRKVCILCKYGVQLDYKNPKLLSQFVSPFTGQLYERHITRLCAKQQHLLKQEIKRSREAGYMAVMVKSVEFLKDPQLFDPNNPIRPHKY